MWVNHCRLLYILRSDVERKSREKKNKHKKVKMSASFTFITEDTGVAWPTLLADACHVITFIMETPGATSVSTVLAICP